MLNEKEEKILDLIRIGGPILPIKVSKNLGVETYLAGAMLSGLAKNGHVLISQRKVGSSPVYYIKGQEKAVRDIIGKEINDLEKKAIDRILNLKVAFDTELYPQERFLLKELKDFVTPLTVKAGEQELNIWKHNSISDQELNDVLNLKMNSMIKKPEEPIPAKPEVPATEAPLVFEKPRKKRASPAKESGEFFKTSKEYLLSKGADIIHEQKIKAGEWNFSISVTTPFGKSSYLVKSKDKSKITESEISQFYVECMGVKMTGLLLVPAMPPKKTILFIEKNFGKILSLIVIN